MRNTRNLYKFKALNVKNYQSLMNEMAPCNYNKMIFIKLFIKYKVGKKT